MLSWRLSPSSSSVVLFVPMYLSSSSSSPLCTYLNSQSSPHKTSTLITSSLLPHNPKTLPTHHMRSILPFTNKIPPLSFLFSFFAAGYYQLGYNPTAAGAAHAVYYFKIAGGFGFVAMIMGWYLAVITACASTGVPCPLPIFDLSSKVFAHNENALKGEHAGANTSAVRDA